VTVVVQPRMNKRRLLVVEDDPGDVQLLREMLKKDLSHATEVVHAESIAEAEKQLAKRPVDVILLDLGLRDAKGLEDVRRAHLAAPDVPLVVLTGVDDESLTAQALQEGAHDYLIKGQIEARDLLRAVRHAMERKILDDGRKAAESQLLQGQKLESLGRLAGGIAHDFNNMLFAIHGYAELLAQDLASEDPERLDPERLLPSVDAISEAAERATILTAQLLAFSRQQIVTPKVLDINAAVNTVEPMLNQLTGENMRLAMKLDPGVGNIRADAGQIGQIIVNLVVNARDAMPDGGTVTIETGNVAFEESYRGEHFEMKPGPFVLLAVSDTGMGMDRETRDHIFEPFYTTKDVGKGTGLGLATTYGIVHQAGGHIWVYSEPGHGSTFKLYFPRVNAAVDEPRLGPVPTTVGVGRVLVVEDEPAVRDMTTQLLERAGFDVLAVADGIEALSIARLAQPIEVLVTDVVMPNLSGIELAEQMMDHYPLMGVVLLSGYTAETLDIERVTARGATFVPKPVTSSQLLQTVLHAVDSRRAAAERQ
jgi:two-component system, cell cycle sensor histidine kinase and response regulator CckA